MFKKTLFNFIGDILEGKMLEQELFLDRNYEKVYYTKDVPTAINPETGNAWEYKQEEVIPFTEGYNQETPSVNLSDRSEFVMSFNIFFNVKKKDKVHDALEAYRTYFFENKIHVLDGYNVAFKVVRGNKGVDVQTTGGNMFNTYTLNVYATATKTYIVGDDVSVKIKLKGDVDYTTAKYIQDLSSTDYGTKSSQKGEVLTHYANIKSTNLQYQLYYENNTLMKELYKHCVGQGTRNQVFTIETTFDDMTFTYTDLIVLSAGRTVLPNETVIMEVSFGVYDG